MSAFELVLETMRHHLRDCSCVWPDLTRYEHATDEILLALTDSGWRRAA